MEDKGKLNKQIHSGKSVEKYSGSQKDRTGLFVALSTGGVAVILLLGILYFSYGKQSREKIALLETENMELISQKQVHDSLVNEWVISMTEIERELQILQGKEEQLIQQSFGPEISPDLKAGIMKEIEEIHVQLENNKTQIANLTSKLKKSGIKIASLNKKIVSLEASIATRDSSLSVLKNNITEKDIQLAELNTTVESLNGNIREYEEDLQDFQVMVDMQTEAMNKAYVAAGNVKELEENGVIEKEGGFLGLGKSKTVKEDLNETPFQSVDISQTRKIALNVKKATLISEHPTDSYELVENDSTIAFLEIKDPAQFWKITRYAVVATKN